MSKKKAINFDLSEIADGGVQVKLNRALQQVADNILDPNTDPTKKRTTVMARSFKLSNINIISKRGEC